MSIVDIGLISHTPLFEELVSREVQLSLMLFLFGWLIRSTLTTEVRIHLFCNFRSDTNLARYRLSDAEAWGFGNVVV